jgi:hypothetical protein
MRICSRVIKGKTYENETESQGLLVQQKLVSKVRSNFSSAEPNVNALSSLFELIYI